MAEFSESSNEGIGCHTTILSLQFDISAVSWILIGTLKKQYWLLRINIGTYNI